MNYVFHAHQFSFDDWVRRLMDNGVVSTVLSYAAVAVQLAFVPLVLLGRRTGRLIAVSLVALMHLGIMAFLGLVGFGLNVLAADSIFLDDETYEEKTLRLRSLFSGLRTRVSRQREELASG